MCNVSPWRVIEISGGATQKQRPALTPIPSIVGQAIPPIWLKLAIQRPLAMLNTLKFPHAKTVWISE